MTYGYMGSILRIDLTAERVSSEQPQESFYRHLLGGRGFIAYFLLKEVRPGIDPLSPHNKLVFACGPVTGGPISGSGRSSVGAKSPLTGAYGEAETGGFWGVELKRAGFDAVIISGKATEPVYLWIHEGKAEIMDASHLWGMEVKKSQETIRKDLKDSTVRIAQIGPGGERIVRYASVINELNHAAGRCGMGAVMGSKNLKAVVVKGHGKINVHDPVGLQQLSKWMMSNLDKVAGSLHKYGTGFNMDVHEAVGNLPIRNFRDGKFSDVDLISAQTIERKMLIGMETCFACVIRCKKKVRIEGRWAVDPDYGGPEYETLAAFGSNCGVSNLEAICKANEICQRYSLDTISTGVVTGFAMECYEKGLLGKKDTGGLELSFGNAEAMVKIAELIGKREGIGDLLAEGARIAATRISKEAEELAIHVKGQEVPMHDPRYKAGLGLGYALSPTGADHMHNIHDTVFAKDCPEKYKGLGISGGIPIADLGPEKVHLFHQVMTWESLNNCLLLCMLTPWSVQQKVEIVRSITGWNTTTQELMRVSERALNLARIFNIREGFRDKDDWLPSRFFKPQKGGPLSNIAVDPKSLREAKLMYYDSMGWNEDGIPQRTILTELGIEWAANQLSNT